MNNINSNNNIPIEFKENIKKIILKEILKTLENQKSYQLYKKEKNEEELYKLSLMYFFLLYINLFNRSKEYFEEEFNNIIMILNVFLIYLI